MNMALGTDGSEAEINFGRLVRAIFDSWKWITFVVLLAGLTTFVAVNLVAPKYRAETKILIESNETVFTGKDRGQEEDRALLDQQGVISQAQLLESVDLARAVIAEFGLTTREEFNPIVGSFFSGLLVDFGIAPSLSDAERKRKDEEAVLERYFDRLQVFPVEDSRVLVVRFWSEDAKLAAQIANGIVKEYFRRQASAKRSTTTNAISLLEPQIKTLQDQARAAQQRAREFRSGADLLLGANNQTLGQQQLAELSSQLSAARARKSDAEAKASLIRELLRSGSALETASDVLSSQFIQRLRERQVALKARIAELSTTLLSNHPQIKGLRSQLADLENQIAAEARKIVRGFESEARLADAQMASLEDSLNELKAQAARANEQEVRLAELERDATVKTARLETLMGQFREVDTRRSADLLPVDASQISSASAPLKPFSPNKTAIIVGVTLATLLLCLGYVVMREFLSGNVFLREGEHGYSPDVPSEADMDHVYGPSDEDYYDDDFEDEVHEPQSGRRAFAGPPPPLERYRNDNIAPLAKTGRRGAQGPRLNKAVAHLVRPFDESYDWLELHGLACTIVASREDEDLAVDTALELARETTDKGQSCILIALRGDVDAIESADPSHAVMGFAELVEGEASFAEVIYQDVASRAHIIPAGRWDAAIDDIDVEQFGFLLGALTQTYDRVLVSLGPLGSDLGTVDLLKSADSILLGVEWGQDEKWGLAAFETLTAHGFGQVFVTMAPVFDSASPVGDVA